MVIFFVHFSYCNIIQISCLPHIFEVFLWDEINEEISKCTFDGECVLFELQKTNSLQWEHLTLQKSKEELKTLKCEILNNIIEKCQKKSEKKAGKCIFIYMLTNYVEKLIDVKIL